jgi:hypothetical protein
LLGWDVVTSKTGNINICHVRAGVRSPRRGEGEVMTTHFWQGDWRGKSPAGDTHIRARDIVRPTGTIIRGKFPSRKNGRMVQYEGLLERDAIYLFETSPNIICYREQPLKVSYPDGARLRRYTPDFELILNTGELVLVEIKPTRSQQKPEVGHKLACIRAFLNLQGQQFTVLDENHIRIEPRLSNLRWLFHQVPREPSSITAICNAICRCKDGFPMSFNDAINRMSGSGTDIYSALLIGALQCPLNLPVSLDTAVTITTETNDAWFWISKEHGF